MSDHDKMHAFGTWLAQRRRMFEAELAALSVDRSKPIDAIRIKGGHLEVTTLTLQAFTELYNKDLDYFRSAYLGLGPKEEETDGDSRSSTQEG